MRGTGYNSRQQMQKITRVVWLLAAALAMVQAAVAASEWDAATTRLAAQIVSLIGPGNASLTFRNLSPLSPSEVAAIRVPLETQLRASGVQLRDPGSSTSEIQVTISENVHEWLIVAEVRQGPDTKIVMTAVEKTASGALTRSGSVMAIRKTFLISQSEPILDAAVVESGNIRNLLVLSGSAIALYELNSGKWNLQQSFPIAHAGIFPADLRGKIQMAQDHLFDAYLPGVNCTSSAGAPLAVSCRDTDDPWPLGTQKAFFNSARNYFTGILAPGMGTQAPPFYSAATLPRGNYTLWLFAAIDGQVVSWDGVALRAIPGTSNWGSDMISMKSSCGLGTQLLVTAAGDDTTTDSLHAYEIVDREPNEVASAATMDGPVTALWQNADGSSAFAVVHNLQTGQYDAYNVTIACNQ